MEHDTADIYRRMTRAFTENDRATLESCIAPDVVWHTDDHQDDVPNEFRGREAFFAVVEQAREKFAGWEVIPHAVLGDGRIAFSHQIDRLVLPDGTSKDLLFNLYMEFNDQGQVKEVWEFGQSKL